MPKKNKKGQRQGGSGSMAAALLKLPGAGSRQNTDDERDTLDNWSTTSLLSDDGSLEMTESVGSGEGEDTSAQEILEDGLKECIDNLTHKSAQVRKVNLGKLNKALQLKYLKDFLMDRRETVLDALEKCIRKGKGEEQVVAVSSVAILMAQLGSEVAKPLESILSLLTYLLLDNSTSPKTREQCAKTIAFCYFMLNEDELQVGSAMKAMSDVFKTSLTTGTGVPPSQAPEVCSLNAHALESWCLLLTLAPPHLLADWRESYLDKLNRFLCCPNVDLRIAGGEAIALVYELTRYYTDESFEGAGFAELCELLHQLATDSQKHRSKKDRRVQRASFRDILRYVEESEAPESEIKFGKEVMYLDNWMQRLHYQTFCDVLGSGINTHLKENELLRDIFGLGAPLPPGFKMEKLSKVQRNMISKERGKARARQRDKRSVTANGF